MVLQLSTVLALLQLSVDMGLFATALSASGCPLFRLPLWADNVDIQVGARSSRLQLHFYILYECAVNHSLPGKHERADVLAPVVYRYELPELVNLA